MSKFIKQTKSVATKARYKDISRKLKEIASALKNNIDEHTDIDGLIDYELKKQKKLLGLIPKKNVDTIQFQYPSKEQIKTAALFKPITTDGYGMTYQSYLDGIETGLFNTWDASVRTGYLTGQTTQQIVRNVMGAPTQAGKLVDKGTMNSLRNSVYANTRTALQSFANATMERVYEANDDLFGSVAPDGVEYKYEYLATLDNRTCLVCAEAAHLYKELKDVPNIPQHRGCRCNVIPYFNIEGDTRSSKNGQVRADITFDEWLRDQDEKTQRDILGATRFKMFQDGAKINQFVDNGKVLTLPELYSQIGISASEDVNESTIERAYKGILKSNGFITRYNDKTYEEKIDAIHDWLIRKESMSGVERGVLIDREGNILLITKGTKSNVILGGKRMMKILNEHEDNTLTFIHNHPNQTTLSLKDLMILNTNLKMEKVVAVTKYGKRYEMSLGKEAERYTSAELNDYYKKKVIDGKGDGNDRLLRFAKKVKWLYNPTEE